jgi:hypothetical protein
VVSAFIVSLIVSSLKLLSVFDALDDEIFTYFAPYDKLPLEPFILPRYFIMRALSSILCALKGKSCLKH